MEDDLLTYSKDYFHHLNPLAQKFATDLESIKDAYQDLWSTFTEKEQEQILDESIINPAAILKYAHIQESTSLEIPHTYSWFTKSQLNLSTDSKPNETLDKLSGNNRNIQKERSVSHEIKKKNEVEEILPPSGKLPVHKSSILKPRAPPPPPPVTKTPSPPCVEQNNVDVTSDIPKTGFDFLDNW